MNKKNMVFNFKNLTFLIFALRAVSDIYLAFAYDKYIPVYATIVSIIVYLTIPLGILYILKNSCVSLKNIYLLIIPFMYWLILVIHTYGGYEWDWMTSLVAISCFLLMKDNDKSKIFNIFFWIIQVNNIISVFMYLCYLIDINIGFTPVLYYLPNSELYGFYYQKWGIFAICSNGISDRLCGIFNEPGALGTICALLLIVKFKNCRLWEKILLITAVLCTLSLAGFLLLFLYAAFYLIRKNHKYIFCIILLFIAFWSIPKIDWENDVINAFASRFEITDKGLSGDNRTTKEFDEKFNKFINSKDALFGRGAGYSLASGSLTYKFYIVEFGIVGFVLFLWVWIFMAIKSAERNPDCFIFLILFMISLYQRPNNLRSIYGYVLLFGGIEWIKTYTNQDLVYRIEKREI